MDGLIEVSKKIEEFSSRLVEGIKKVVESESFQAIIKSFAVIDDLRKYGKRNWVVIFAEMYIEYDKMPENIDLFFSERIDENDCLNRIKDRLIGSNNLVEKRELINQVFFNVEKKKYAIAGIALSTVIEYLLASNIDINMQKIEKIIEKFKNGTDEISISNEGMLYVFGLDGFFENYSRSSNGFEIEKEFEYPNRHWIAHGRMHRDITKEEVYQMLCAIYAIDVIINTEYLGMEGYL